MAYNIFMVSFFFFFFLFDFCVEFSAAQKVPALFIFGDSIVDVGNNNHIRFSIAKADLPHYGIDFSPDGEPNGRFTNGKNPSDFLAEKLDLPTSPPYLALVDDDNRNNVSFRAGVNFASGAARILETENTILRQYLPLSKQIEYFSNVYEHLYTELGASGVDNLFSKSIFVIVIGGNDILSYFESSSRREETPPQVYVASIPPALKAKLRFLHNNGARKFLVVGVPPLGCCPTRRKEMQNRGCDEETNFWSLKYNDGVASMLQELKTELKDFQYSYFNTYKVVQNLIQQPAVYGFVEAKAACCGGGDLRAELFCLPVTPVCANRSDHIFFDKLHPTESAYRIIVDLIFSGSSQYTFPMNLQQLVAL